ncbi:hypothetical protein ACFFIX_21150 [Metabacillus herbersteinensis]|uniref:DinB family protein n=2 Tax=Metabacillus herbersteinensis TaxID=283816 RepID=A0ABV6GK41_9BACI
MENHLLRHYLATIAFRASKALTNIPKNFPDFETGKGVRKPLEILHHMSDVLTLACIAFEIKDEQNNEVQSWEKEIDRFYHQLEQLDEALAQNKFPTTLTIEQILQGPFADVMTHIGQLYTLRRLADSPVTGESFIKASITIGHIRY